MPLLIDSGGLLRDAYLHRFYLNDNIYNFVVRCLDYGFILCSQGPYRYHNDYSPTSGVSEEADVFDVFGAD